MLVKFAAATMNLFRNLGATSACRLDRLVRKCADRRVRRVSNPLFIPICMPSLYVCRDRPTEVFKNGGQ